MEELICWHPLGECTYVLPVVCIVNSLTGSGSFGSGGSLKSWDIDFSWLSLECSCHELGKMGIILSSSEEFGIGGGSGLKLNGVGSSEECDGNSAEFHLFLIFLLNLI